MFLRTLVIIAFMLTLTPSWGQQDFSKRLPSSIQFNFKLPTPTFNRAFRGLVNGVSDVNIHAQMPLFKSNVVLGGGFKHSFMQFDDLKSDITTNGKFNFFKGYAKVSYQKFVNERFFYDMGIKAGYGFANISSDLCRDSSGVSSTHLDAGLFLEPSVGLYMISEDNLSFGLVLGYTYLQDDFDPAHLCIADVNLIDAGDNVGAYQWFSVGFGASVFIGRNAVNTKGGKR